MVISSIFADDFTNFLDERFLLTIFFSDLWGERAHWEQALKMERLSCQSRVFWSLLSHIIFAICSTLIWSNKQQLIFKNTLVNWFEHTLLQHALKSIQKMWTNKISFYRIPDTSSIINLQNILRKITVF